VLFESTARNTATLERRIEAHLREALGYEVATFIRTAPEVREVARYKPFPAADVGVLYIGFVAQAPAPEAIQKLLRHTSPVNAFHVHGREVYWLCRTRSSESDFSGAQLEKALGQPATLRNSTTVTKIAAMFK
jgi:uncharacterized protein (DUF1697 family)